MVTLPTTMYCVDVGPSPAAYAVLLSSSHSPDHDFAVVLACACDVAFEDAFSSDCVDPSSMALTSRKW